MQDILNYCRTNGDFLHQLQCHCPVVSSNPNLIYIINECGQLQFSQYLCNTNKIQRIALLIHGFSANARALVALGQFLSLYQPPKCCNKLYDIVLAYEYESLNSGIAEIASRLLANLIPLLQSNCDIVFDVYAHSIGGLVARHAIEQLGFGMYVDKLFLFGTPNAGIPLAAVDLFRLFTPDLAASPILIDVTEGSPFLQRLNTGTSPFIQCIKYYTIAGTRFKTYNPVATPLVTPFGTFNSVGEFVNTFFNTIAPGTITDGFVTLNTVQSPILAQKSAFWAFCPQAKITLFLDHNALVGRISLPPLALNPGEEPYIFALPIEIVCFLISVLCSCCPPMINLRTNFDQNETDQVEHYF